MNRSLWIVRNEVDWERSRVGILQMIKEQTMDSFPSWWLVVGLLIGIVIGFGLGVVL